MKYEIFLGPEAIQDFQRLSARNRATVRDTIEKHLRFEPNRISKRRIKRLRGMRRPQYRLRVGDIRVFYDIVEDMVEILAVVEKSDATDWLAEIGEVE